MEELTREEMMQKIMDISRVWYLHGISLYNLRERPLEIRWDLSGTTAGQARRDLSQNTLWFNLDIAVENQFEFLDQIIPHEVAHIIADEKHQTRCGHGDLWKSVMRDFGRIPERCHDFSVEHLKHEKSTIYIELICVDCGQKMRGNGSVAESIRKNEQKRSCCKCQSKNLKVLEDTVRINGVKQSFEW